MSLQKKHSNCILSTKRKKTISLTSEYVINIKKRSGSNRVTGLILRVYSDGGHPCGKTVIILLKQLSY